MFEGLIDQVAARFGIGQDKVRQLLPLLAGLMFNQSGGFAGFLDRFRQQGLGDIVQSWVGTGPNLPISPAQVESGLGAPAIDEMAGKVGVDRGALTGALSGLLPNMVDQFTAGGQIPAAMPAGLAGLLGGVMGAGGATARAAGATATAAGATAAAAGATAVREVGGGMSRLLPWLGIIVLALIAFFAFRSCHREAAPVAAVEPAPVATTPASVPERALEKVATDANAALDALTGKSFTADDLVKALNLMSIQFDTGSARVSADSMAILSKAAAAIKAAPAGTRIEIGGHTDNTGNAASNMKLSRDRAAAVVSQLVKDGVDAKMLTSQGYGQDKPIADNSTDEGRAKNRRMAFTVLH